LKGVITGNAKRTVRILLFLLTTIHYSADGSLLATSIPNYVIRFDAKAPKEKF
jgi:hypothetical protein